jgi:hypothetical protein
MSIEWDTVISAIGALIFLGGIYLWLGLAASLILLGIILIYVGARMQLPAKGNKESE